MCDRTSEFQEAVAGLSQASKDPFPVSIIIIVISTSHCFLRSTESDLFFLIVVQEEKT